MVSSFRIRQACIFLVVATTCYILYSSLSLGGSNPQLETPTVDKLAVNVVGEDDEEKRAGGETATKRKFLLSDQSCNIPKLDINGSEVISFFHKPKPLNCHRKNPLNWAFINEEGKLELISSKKDASCKIGYFVRKDDAENYEDAVDLSISEGERLKHDFAKISCTLGDSKWSGLLMTVAENEEVRKRAQEKKREDTPMSVYFMGFDSLSQMSFRRNMPKTVDFLENTLESVVLNGYNIIGDGTPQAFIPILTAKTEEELPLTRKRYKKANYVDDVYPFIWENFTSNGYATLYAEDAFNIGTFTYRLKGFRKQPTDHFTRTFFKENEKKSFNQWNCLGSETLHENWFRYSREFMQRYSDLPRFLLMHQSLLSHDDINQVNVEDEDFANHLKTMYNAGEFENTLVIVMADHGHRFAQLRSTHQGQLEERLPFFSFALPEKFRTTERGALIYENLKNNKNRLSTPFDIHATLMDIISSPSTAELTTVQSAEKRSLSLFRPVPVNRSCAQADVAPHWCTCLNWKDAMSDEEDKQLSSRLADIVVDTINKQLANVTNLCAALKLNQLISSKKLMPNEGLLKYKNVKDADGFVPDLSGSTTASFAHFQLKLSTAPGRAVYEVTLFYDFHKKTADIDLTSISHVNKFGDDPHCIIDTNYFLATYCVCHDRV